MPDLLDAPAPTAPVAAPSTETKSTGTQPASTATETKSTGNQTEQEAQNESDSAFDRMESRFKAKSETKSDPAPSETKPATAPAATATAKAASAKEPEQKPVVATEKKDERTTSEGPKALREQLAKTSKERDESAANIKKYEAKIKEWESKGLDTAALTEQLAREQKEKEDLMAQVRMLRKEVDPAFKEKWDKPFEQAAEYARRVVEGLEVQVKDEAGDVTSTRPAKWDDFAALYSLPIAKAARQAREMFGEDASLVVNKLENLHQLDYQRQSALEDEKKKWKENESAELANETLKRERFQKLTSTIRQKLIEEKPDLYDENPDDPEGNELLKLGREYMAYVPKTEEEAARTYERNKLNAEAAPRLAHRLEKATARISELESIIEELKGSGPGDTKRKGGGDTASPRETSLMDALQEAVNV